MDHSSQWSVRNLCVYLDDPILRYTRVRLWQESHSSGLIGLRPASERFESYRYGRRMDALQPFDTSVSTRQLVNVAAR